VSHHGRLVEQQVDVVTRLWWIRERLVIYCQPTSIRTAHASHRATYCTPCRPLIRAFSGWITSPPPTVDSTQMRECPARAFSARLFSSDPHCADRIRLEDSPGWLTRGTVSSKMRKAARPELTAVVLRCSAGAGCSAIKYQYIISSGATRGMRE